jgi:hypothetical protein
LLVDPCIGSALLDEGLVVRMVVCFNFGISQFMEKMHMAVLEGRHGGLVGTRALGKENGPCLLYGYDYGFVFSFLCLSFASQWML